MSAKLKVKEKSTEVKGDKISFNSSTDFMAIRLNGLDGKPYGPTYVEHKHLAKKLIDKKAATEVKDAVIEVSKSPTQILDN